jgi:hypothetical protein
MLKWLLGALLLANIGVWMWASWYDRSPESVETAPRPLVNADKMLAPGEPGARLVPRVPHRPVQTHSLTAVVRTCYVVGSFKKLAPATDAGTRLKKKGLRYTLRSEPTTDISFQVYLGPYSSTRSAVAAQHRLRRIGIRDNALIREGKLKNAVSVGVFRNAANIKETRNLLRKHHYHPHTRAITQVTNRYWLEIPSEQTSLDSLRALKWSAKDIEVKQASCGNAPSR